METRDVISSERFRVSPPLAVVLAASGLWCLAASWMWTPLSTAGTRMILTGAGLVLLVVLAYAFPIQIGSTFKVEAQSTALFLMAVMLPAGLAATSAALGILAGEVWPRGTGGKRPSDIVGQISRWTVLVTASSLTGRTVSGGPAGHAFSLIAAAVVLWVGDMVSLALLCRPVRDEQPISMMRSMVLRHGRMEGGQIVFGIVSGFLVFRQPVALALLAPAIMLLGMTFKPTDAIQGGTRRVLETLADAVDQRDAYTGGHSDRVAQYARGILREMGQSGPNAQIIEYAARVHDIGKISIPDAILGKEGPLTDQERLLMETHSESGARMLTGYPDFSRGAHLIRHHHERWDGLGYPHGLAGVEIPLGSRVIAVADAYDAITSDRPYRQGLSHTVAAAILREGRGRQWQTEIVDALLRGIAAQTESAQPNEAPRSHPFPLDTAERVTVR